MGSSMSGFTPAPVFTVAQIYTGSGFDINFTTSTTGTPFELNDVTASVSNNKTYATIEILSDILSSCEAQNSASTTSILIEKKSLLGAYSTVINTTLLATADANVASITSSVRDENFFKFLIALTANDKSEGFKIRITVTGAISGTGRASLTNTQTVLTVFK